MKFAQLGLLLPFLWSTAYAGSALDQKQKNLQEYEQKLSEQRHQLKSLLGREGAILREVDQSSRKLDELDEEIDRLNSERKQVEQRIGETSAEKQKALVDIDARKEGVARRLRQIYIWGRPNPLQILLASDGVADWRERRVLMRYWLERDRSLLEVYGKRVERLSDLKAQLEADGRSQKRIMGDLASRKTELEKQKESREQVLALVRTQKDFYQQSIHDLERAAKDLQNLIETLQRERKEESSLFERMKGKLPFPAAGKVERRFGSYTDPTLQAKVNQKGIDVKAPAGAPIRAVFDGKVVYSGWFTGYGKILILDHGGGYFTLYAHASKLFKKVGDAVTVGDTIAEVGDTGSLKGARLYFELRYRGISQDPSPWFADERTSR